MECVLRANGKMIYNANKGCLSVFCLSFSLSIYRDTDLKGFLIYSEISFFLARMR